jgi:folate-binding protein YgfZ
MLQTTQKNASILLSDHCLLSVTGADAVKLLQGQLTADVQALVPGQGQLAAHCQAQGRVISLFLLFRTHDGFILCLPQGMETIATTALRKYAVFYKTNIQPINHYFVTAYANTPTTSAAVAKAVLPNGTTYLLNETPHASSTHTLADYYHHLITHQIPCILPETSGEFVPHDLNLLTLGAVSLTKGCYTGQEIIARMEYKGTLKKQCHTACVNEAVNINDDVFLQGKSRAVGRIINVSTFDNKTYTVLMLLDNTALHNPLTTTQQTPYHLLTENERSHD